MSKPLWDHVPTYDHHPKTPSNQKDIDELKKENEELRKIVKSTLWMARRYADGRSTYAPSIVNECIEAAEKLKIKVSSDAEPKYAEDGMFGKWNPSKKNFEKDWGLGV